MLLQRNKIFLQAALLLILIRTEAQQITVYSSLLEPVANVAVFNHERTFSALTDKEGKCAVTALQKSDTLYFQHPAYHSLSLTIREIAMKGYRVILTDKVLVLDEYVVAAAKTREKLENVAHQVDIVKASEIVFSNAPTPAEALENSGKIFIQRSHPGGGSPIIRGMEANKVLIVVDNIRMNNAIYRGTHQPNITSIDEMIVDRIEIVQGPGSLIYGSDALGGVMHFYTKKPELADSNTMKVSGNLLIRGGSANFEKTGHFDINLGWKKFASLSSITFSDFDDLRMGSRQNAFYKDFGKRYTYVRQINGIDSIVANSNPLIQRPSAYWQVDVLQKFLLPLPRAPLTFNFQFSTSSDIPRYDRLGDTETVQDTLSFSYIYADTVLQVDSLRTLSRLKWAENNYGPQTRFLAGMEINLNRSSRLYDEGMLVVAYQKVFEERNQRRFRQPERVNRTEEVDIVTLNMDLVRKLDIRNTLQYGIETVFNYVRSRATVLNLTNGESWPTLPRFPDAGSFMQTTAAYARYNFHISERFTISSGFRYSLIMLQANFSSRSYYPMAFRDIRLRTSAFSGSFGLVYNPGRRWQLNLLFASGYRAPNLDNAGKISSLETSPDAQRVLVPNANLKPEYVYNVELGIRKNFYDKVHVSAMFFNTLGRDMITVQPFILHGMDSLLYDGELSRIYAYVNISKASIRGFSIAAQADVTRYFAIHSTLTGTWGKNESDNTPLDHIPPLFGQTSLVIKFNKFRGELLIRYNGWKHVKDYAPEGADNLADATALGTPAWYTVSLRAGYQINPRLRLQAALENMLDQHYRQFSSGISAPGIHAVVMLKLSF
ncbi:MAG: hypothetical protein KatS3mg031_0519 [Chitinophagales bacterium]|nr:MAG: hypothetical protein KatS3mg031_0519 [Chitinophagales bacterium]